MWSLSPIPPSSCVSSHFSIYNGMWIPCPSKMEMDDNKISVFKRTFVSVALKKSLYTLTGYNAAKSTIKSIFTSL